MHSESQLASRHRFTLALTWPYRSDLRRRAITNFRPETVAHSHDWHDAGGLALLEAR